MPYNGILGRPALAKFIAARHYAYNVLKMPGPMSVITIPCDRKGALICTDKIFREAVAASAAKANAPAAQSPGKKKQKPGKTSGDGSGKRSSPECSAAVEDIPESSAGKSKKSKAAPPEVKKVSAKEDGTGGTFTISSTLDDK